MESKKKKGSFGKTIAIVLLFIVFIALAFILGQYASSKMDYNIFKAKGNDVAKENKKSDDSEKLPEKSKEHTFIKSIARKIYLNNNEHTLMVYYYSDSIDKKMLEEFDNGSEENNNSKALYEEIYLDNNKILSMNEFYYSKNDDEINDIIESETDNHYNYEKIMDTENSKEYMILNYKKGVVGSYLLGWDGEAYGNAILVSDEGKVLDTYLGGKKPQIVFTLNEAKSITDRTLDYFDSSSKYLSGYKNNILDLEYKYTSKYKYVVNNC